MVVSIERHIVSGYGERGWECDGCQVPQIHGTPFYYIYHDGKFMNFRCVRCTQEMGLVW